MSRIALPYLRKRSKGVGGRDEVQRNCAKRENVVNSTNGDEEKEEEEIR